jgi:D-tyrosyl-tRNA(Tyr) deacylase
MRAVVQRVRTAKVEVSNRHVAEIQNGLLVYLGIQKSDGAQDVGYIVEKIVGLRVFDDNEGKMNLALPQVDGEVLLISQFTLYGDCRKGKRPSFSEAAPPEMAKRIYESVVSGCRSKGIRVKTGIFRETMQVHSVNDGPVTLLLDSAKIL